MKARLGASGCVVWPADLHWVTNIIIHALLYRLHNVLICCCYCIGTSNCGMNVHLLIHLPHYVTLFGPLWTHSAFAFEGQMQNFLSHSHATHGIGKQVW